MFARTQDALAISSTKGQCQTDREAAP
jgi:hypothetical protein